MAYLREHLTFDQAKVTLESQGEGEDKSLYLKGICIQGGVKNANQRVYPVSEIGNAVRTLKDQIDGGYSVLGEVDHPDDLKVNLDRVSHMITDMWMDGPNGFGKMKILPTPMGNLVKTMLESGVKLGVSSRGSGEVNESTGEVNGLAQPSAPGAYPTPIYEHFMNTRGGYSAIRAAQEVSQDAKAQKYLKEQMLRVIKGLQ
jgi:hypothetical protein